MLDLRLARSYEPLSKILHQLLFSEVMRNKLLSISEPELCFIRAHCVEDGFVKVSFHALQDVCTVCMCVCVVHLDV